MQIFAGLSVLVLMLTALVVLIKMLLLWRRTRGLPELLMALYLLFATVLGYPLAIAMGMIPASESWQIHVAAEAITAVGWTALLFFTLTVFRRDSMWARCLVGVTVCLIIANVAAYAVEVTSLNPRTPQEIPGFTAAISTPIAIVYVWTTFEAFAYYRLLRRRLALRLVEPAVVNRTFLWGLMALSSTLALVVNIVALLAGFYLTPPIVLASSVLGLVIAVCLFLAFHPPAWYTHWLDRSAAVPEEL